MNLDFLNKIIATFLAKFKTANPVVFIVLAALLSAVKYFLENAYLVNIPVPAQLGSWLLWFVGLFIASPTTKFLNQDSRN